METLDRALKEVEVKIRDDGRVIWINSPTGCIMRICGIEYIRLEDERPPEEPREGAWDCICGNVMPPRAEKCFGCGLPRGFDPKKGLDQPLPEEPETITEEQAASGLEKGPCRTAWEEPGEGN